MLKALSGRERRRILPPPFLGLVLEDPKEPGANLGPSLEPINRLDKRYEDILDEILRFAL